MNTMTTGVREIYINNQSYIGLGEYYYDEHHTTDELLEN